MSQIRLSRWLRWNNNSLHLKGRLIQLILEYFYGQEKHNPTNLKPRPPLLWYLTYSIEIPVKRNKTNGKAKANPPQLWYWTYSAPLQKVWMCSGNTVPVWWQWASSVGGRSSPLPHGSSWERPHQPASCSPFSLSPPALERAPATHPPGTREDLDVTHGLKHRHMNWLLFMTKIL